MTSSVAIQLSQLEDARKIVLGDAALYPQIVQGILPIIGPGAVLELRRWGAEFLSETFASPTIGSQQKEHMSLIVLQTLRTLLENPSEDAGVVKSVIQAAASVYGPIFRYIINNSHDTQTWNNMAAIKSNILRRWDHATAGVRMCCIKFVQRVVQLQTPGQITDPRRPDQNELSLALVPRDHPLIPPLNLEPEASGLLDRLLDVFNEQSRDPVLVTATLNCLAPLLRTRQTIANKIMSAILNFNPLKHAYPQMNTKVKIQIKSVERTIRTLLLNILRRNESGAFAGRIKQHVERLSQARIDLFDESSRKRGPPEPTDGLDNAKRMRLGAEVLSRPQPPPLPPGPVSLAQLFTLTSDVDLTKFHVEQLPIDLVVKITLPVLHGIQQPRLEEAINTVRSRLLALTQTPVRPPQASGGPYPSGTEEDDDDYEPDFEPTEDAEQIRNKVDALPPEDSLQTPTEVALGPFKLPQPPPLTAEETEQIGKGTISRVFGMMNVLDEPSLTKRQKPGLNRLAGSSYDRDAWMTVITRLATRAPAGLDDDSEDDARDDTNMATVKQRNAESSLSDSIRETLWKYVVEDFRIRIPIAISWLNEEWFSDRLQLQFSTNGDGKASKPERDSKRQHYQKWVLKVLDAILPYLEPKDKLLIRFLSEIPAIDQNILQRVKSLARDPERVNLAVQAIHYLIIVRPPVRDICIDALEDLWRNYEDARLSTQKLLQKWRPDVLEEKKPPPSPPQPESTPQPSPSGTAATTNGIKSATANNIAPTSNGVTKGETITGGGGLEIADTGGSKTERGGSVVAAVG